MCATRAVFCMVCVAITRPTLRVLGKVRRGRSGNSFSFNVGVVVDGGVLFSGCDDVVDVGVEYDREENDAGPAVVAVMAFNTDVVAVASRIVVVVVER